MFSALESRMSPHNRSTGQSIYEIANIFLNELSPL
jgi:hypothetical protein